ncbi:MAG: thioesterase family protein [Polyangiaceae bacterium]
MSTTFSQLMRTAKRAAGQSIFEVPADWMQGRSLFGGLQVAIALDAMRTCAPKAPLRTLQATFIAPVPEGPVQARARIVRQGKSATHVEARIEGEKEPLAIVIGVFGSPRPSKAERVPARPNLGADQGLELTYVPGVFPAFTQHFRARWLRGALPFSSQASPEHSVAVGMVDDGALTEGHVVAIADFIPPVALSYLDAPAPGSTLTWMLQFLRDDMAGLPLDGWRIDAELVAARDGYTSQTVHVWGPDGSPVALSHQSMLVFG